VPVLQVEVVCTLETEHRRRVESRGPDIVGHRVPTWQEVLDRDYRPWDSPRLVIDTAGRTVQESVQAITATAGVVRSSVIGRDAESQYVAATQAALDDVRN